MTRVRTSDLAIDPTPPVPRAGDGLDIALAALLEQAEPEHWRAPSEPAGPRDEPWVEASWPEPAPIPEVPAPEEVTEDRRSSVERRRGQRYDLLVHLVRAIVYGDPETAPGRGRVRNMSVSGGLYIETTKPLPFRAAVRADFTLNGGHTVTFAGRVVRKPESTGMAIRLETDEGSRSFLAAFIDEVLRPDYTPSALVVVRRHEGSPADPADPGDEVHLSQAWYCVLERFEDDTTHQEFIERCLKGRRLEYALDRYRALKAERPGDERIERYLEQIGKILGFYAMRPPAAEEAARRRGFPAPFKLMALMIACLALLWIGLLAVR